MRSTPKTGTYVPAGAGPRISFMGMDLVWKVTSEMSRGAYVVFVHDAPPGTGAPVHLHPGEEETIFVIEGRVVVRLGDETFEMGRGDSVHLPRGTAHGFRVTGDGPAQVQFTIDLSPGSDYETMFAGLVGLTPADFERVRAICAANNVFFVEPPALP